MHDEQGGIAMAFQTTSAIAVPIAAALLTLALGGCGDANNGSTNVDTPGAPLIELARACTRYDDLEVAIEAIRNQQAGLPQPPAVGGGIHVARLPDCPPVVERTGHEAFKYLLEPEPTEPVPESRLLALEQRAAFEAAEVERLAAQFHPRL
jgi:hypothetical protein